METTPFVVQGVKNSSFGGNMVFGKLSPWKISRLVQDGYPRDVVIVALVDTKDDEYYAETVLKGNENFVSSHMVQKKTEQKRDVSRAQQDDMVIDSNHVVERTKPISEWDSSDIQNWVKKLGSLIKFVDNFKNVTIKQLFDEQTINNLGILPFAIPQFKLKISELKKQAGHENLSIKITDVTLDKLKDHMFLYYIPMESMEIQKKEEGKGHFSFVQVGLFRGKREKNNGCLVACKTIKKNLKSRQGSKTILDLVYREIRILAKTNHKNVLSFFGFSIDNKKESSIMIITEYMELGSLDKMDLGPLLHYAKIRKDFSLQIARGMEYLHSIKIIHRDLKPDNILLTREYDEIVVKVSDFGLSRELEGADIASSNIGNVIWMAPEVVKDPETEKSPKPFTFSSDVYSFALVVFYLYHEQQTHNLMLLSSGSISRLEELRVLLKEGKRPEIKNGSEAVRKLISECWQNDPIQRPDFPRIVDFLENKICTPQEESEIDFKESTLDDLIENLKVKKPENSEFTDSSMNTTSSESENSRTSMNTTSSESENSRTSMDTTSSRTEFRGTCEAYKKSEVNFSDLLNSFYTIQKH